MLLSSLPIAAPRQSVRSPVRLFPGKSAYMVTHKMLWWLLFNQLKLPLRRNTNISQCQNARRALSRMVTKTKRLRNVFKRIWRYPTDFHLLLIILMIFLSWTFLNQKWSVNFTSRNWLLVVYMTYNTYWISACTEICMGTCWVIPIKRGIITIAAMNENIKFC